MNRKRLPTNRKSVTHKLDLSGFHIYFTIGLFEDGKPGELFIHNIEDTNGKVNDGGMLAGLSEAWAIAISMLLQSGWSVSDLATKFSHIKFEPSGFTDELHYVDSFVDYIIRWMDKNFNIEGNQNEL